MDESATTALATLLGAATGGLTSVLATWLTHRTQARAQWLEQDALRPSVPLGAMIEIPSAALMAETIADYEIVLGELRPSCIPDAASAEQYMDALVKLPTLTPGPPGTKAKMRLESSLAVQLPASAMYF